MPEAQNDDTERHDRQVDAVALSVAKLLTLGFTPEAVFEGAIRGGATALLSAMPISAAEVGALIETVGNSFRHLDKPSLKVVR